MTRRWDCRGMGLVRRTVGPSITNLISLTRRTTFHPPKDHQQFWVQHLEYQCHRLLWRTGGAFHSFRAAERSVAQSGSSGRHDLSHSGHFHAFGGTQRAAATVSKTESHRVEEQVAAAGGAIREHRAAAIPRRNEPGSGNEKHRFPGGAQPRHSPPDHL